MIDQVKEKYKSMDKTQQLRIKQGAVVFVILVVLVLSYGTKTEEKNQDIAQKNASDITEVMTDSQLFEQDISDELDEKLKDKQKVIDQQAQDIAQLKELFALQMQNDQQEESSQNEFNPVDSQASNFPPTQLPGSDFAQDQALIQPQWVGGIVHEEYETIKVPISEQDAQKKRIIKLPPSFMRGFLLTGLDAMTIEGSADIPEPMMIRVQAPAVLPNEVKANLKGCFVIAEGYGNLATHRVDARLKSLSCVNLKGNSVISESIKGYVQDGDGKRGIKGTVIHRAGALLARSMIAGVFEGIGSALTSNAQTTSLSALGQTSSTTNGSLGSAALGGGISAGAKDVRALFLQLARQSSPIIEVGAAKEISVVITELVELKIQDL